MFEITTIETNSDHTSIFSTIQFPQISRNGMFLSEQIEAHNFRLRESHAPYSTDFHLAGDPTLIIIQQGTLRIQLQNGDHKDFERGEMFIAADFLPSDLTFDNKKHGHKAEIVGKSSLLAIHIKLKNWNSPSRSY